MSAANGIPVNHGNNRFGHGAYFTLYIQYVEARNAIFADIAAFSLYILIATGTKSFVTFPRKNDGVNIHIFMAHGKGYRHFGGGSGGEGIVIAWPVDGYFGNMIPILQFDFLKLM